MTEAEQIAEQADRLERTPTAGMSRQEFVWLLKRIEHLNQCYIEAARKEEEERS